MTAQLAPESRARLSFDMRRARLLLLSLSLTFALTRLLLGFAPDTDFNVGAYNIHHLFTGLLLVSFGGIAAVLFAGRAWLLDAATLVFGVGLALALDEWVYLILTDGTNAAYLLPVSFWGGVVMVGLACLYVLALCAANRRRAAKRSPAGEVRVSGKAF